MIIQELYGKEFMVKGSLPIIYRIDKLSLKRNTCNVSWFEKRDKRRHKTEYYDDTIIEFIEKGTWKLISTNKHLYKQILKI